MVANSMKMSSLFQSVDYRVARSRDELEKAYRLVYQEYFKQGYITETEAKMRFSLHNALPDTTTFVAMADDNVMATATVIVDSPLGLPMDELYREHLDGMRSQGKRICEVSMLASSSELFSERIPLMLNAKKMFLVFFLFKHIFDYVREILKIDYICITVHPKHANVYESLFFQELSNDVKFYDKVNGAPAVAKYLDVFAVAEQCATTGRKGLHKMFLAGKPDFDKFSGKVKLTLEDLRYFFSHESSVFDHATADEMLYIKQCYPDYNFSDIIQQSA